MKNKPKKPWAENWDCCQRCGRSDISHAALGLCHKCYMELLRLSMECKSNELETWRKKNKKGQKKLNAWSEKYPCCVVCHSTDYPYAGNGQCRRCYMKDYRKKYEGNKAKKIRRTNSEETISVSGLKVRRQCPLCKQWRKMWPWEAFCDKCRGKDIVRFSNYLPSISQNTGRKIG